MDVDDQIRAIKTAVQNAEKVKARAEIQRDQAKISLIAAAQRLKTEFGVSSLVEAKELRSKVQDRLDLRIQEIQQSLDSFR